MGWLHLNIKGSSIAWDLHSIDGIWNYVEVYEIWEWWWLVNWATCSLHCTFLFFVLTFVRGGVHMTRTSRAQKNSQESMNSDLSSRLSSINTTRLGFQAGSATNRLGSTRLWNVRDVKLIYCRDVECPASTQHHTKLFYPNTAEVKRRRFIQLYPILEHHKSSVPHFCKRSTTFLVWAPESCVDFEKYQARHERQTIILYGPINDVAVAYDIEVTISSRLRPWWSASFTSKAIAGLAVRNLSIIIVSFSDNLRR